ncbi:hypothetical protein H0H93_008742 [Arthromyces matolae]|nr:hypothetical protein H0H93_008742 [Arthromyces matolae]
MNHFGQSHHDAYASVAPSNMQMPDMGGPNLSHATLNFENTFLTPTSAPVHMESGFLPPESLVHFGAQGGNHVDAGYMNHYGHSDAYAGMGGPDLGVDINPPTTVFAATWGNADHRSLGTADGAVHIDPHMATLPALDPHTYLEHHSYDPYAIVPIHSGPTANIGSTGAVHNDIDSQIAAWVVIPNSLRDTLCFNYEYFEALGTLKPPGANAPQATTCLNPVDPGPHLEGQSLRRDLHESDLFRRAGTGIEPRGKTAHSGGKFPAVRPAGLNVETAKKPSGALRSDAPEELCPPAPEKTASQDKTYNDPMNASVEDLEDLIRFWLDPKYDNNRTCDRMREGMTYSQAAVLAPHHTYIPAETDPTKRHQKLLHLVVAHRAYTKKTIKTKVIRGLNAATSTELAGNFQISIQLLGVNRTNQPKVLVTPKEAKDQKNRAPSI